MRTLTHVDIIRALEDSGTSIMKQDNTQSTDRLTLQEPQKTKQPLSLVVTFLYLKRGEESGSDR